MNRRRDDDTVVFKRRIALRNSSKYTGRHTTPGSILQSRCGAMKFEDFRAVVRNVGSYRLALRSQRRFHRIRIKTRILTCVIRQASGADDFKGVSLGQQAGNFGSNGR